MAVTDIYNYRSIDPLLSTSGQPTEEEMRDVADAGFEVVINLALHNDPRYSLPDESDLVDSLGLEYVHLPVQFGAPTEDDMLAFFAAIDTHRGRKLLVHCAANKRVSAFLGLYRVIREGWGIERAFVPMDDVWEPDEVWATFIAEMLAKHRPATSRSP